MRVNQHYLIERLLVSVTDFINKLRRVFLYQPVKNIMLLNGINVIISYVLDKSDIMQRS